MSEQPRRSAESTEPEIRPLDGTAQRALDVLLAAPVVPIPEHRARREELARVLTGWAVGAEGESALDGAARVLAESPVLEDDGDAPPDDGPEEAMGTAAEELRTAGLEWWDVSLYLGTDADADSDDAPTLVWFPVPPETAHVWLLGALYERVEESLLGEPLLLLERQASEWTLVERPALALDDVPVISAFCAQDFFARLPPRQQRLARALRRSRVGVFVVRERGEGETVLESVEDARRFRVHEHNPELDYGPGDFAAGRLIPWEAGRHLRSPGMVIFPGDAPTAPLFAEGLDRMGERAGPRRGAGGPALHGAGARQASPPPPAHLFPRGGGGAPTNAAAVDGGGGVGGAAGQRRGAGGAPRRRAGSGSGVLPLPGGHGAGGVDRGAQRNGAEAAGGKSQKGKGEAEEAALKRRAGCRKEGVPLVRRLAPDHLSGQSGQNT